MSGRQVFVGSTSEKRALAAKIAAAIGETGLSVLPWWSRLAFRAGDITLPRLIQLAKLCEASVLIFGGEDEVWFRPKLSGHSSPQLAARDNVLMEYGLFVGKVGLDKAVIVARKGMKLPSDIDGVTVIFFSEHERHAAVAERVKEHFENLLRQGSKEGGFSDSSLIIHTNWNLPVHHFSTEAARPWNSTLLYEGKRGAQAWARVEKDPAYARRTQTSINGGQIAKLVGPREISTIVSFGPGLGTVDAEVAANLRSTKLREYVPVDVNHHFLLRSADSVTSQNPILECKNAINCDFDHDTSFVGMVIHDHCPGPRLFLMAGGTFGNSSRSVRAQLKALYDVMDWGDVFVFDLFCHGAGYRSQDDPYADIGRLLPSVKVFFADGVRRLLDDWSLGVEQALGRIVIDIEVGTSGLGKTTSFVMSERDTKEKLVSIRRFDFEEITRCIDEVGFSRGEAERVSIGALERHVALAVK